MVKPTEGANNSDRKTSFLDDRKMTVLGVKLLVQTRSLKGYFVDRFFLKIIPENNAKPPKAAPPIIILFLKSSFCID